MELSGKMLLIGNHYSNIHNILEAINLIRCSHCGGWISSTRAIMCTGGQVAAVIKI